MARKLRSAVLGEALEEGVRHFHIISRTVRKEWLISEADMRQQACDVLKRLTRAYAIDMCSFTVMSNHFHTT